MKKLPVPLLLVAVLVAGCPKPKPVMKPAPPPDPATELKKRVGELYAALEAQEPERLNELLTPDVMAFGLGPKDAFTSRDDVVEDARGELIPIGLKGDAFKLARSSVKVGLARDERSGWFYDFPKFDQLRQERAPKHWAVRITGHAVKEDVWRIDAVHVSFGYPDDALYKEPKKLKALASPGTDRGPDSEQVIGMTKRMLEDIALKVERTSDDASAVLIGTDPADVYEGGAHFKQLARPKLPELKKAQFSLKIEDGPRARLAPDGKSGWVAGNVVLRLGSGAKLQVLPAFRALWIFNQENELWDLVSEHQSLGLLPEQRPQAGDEADSLDAGSP